MKIGLQPIKEWSGGKEEIRIYVGSLLCGYARPVKNEIEKYHFDTMLKYPVLDVENKKFGITLEDIKIQIECSLKEFAKKFVKII